MSGAKHTPGPWYPKPAPYGWDIWGNLDTGQDTWVGPVKRVISPHSRIGNGISVEAVSEETEANARLIAAAPDLLAALKRFRTKVYNAALGSGMDHEWATEACSVADAAIAKAEGGAA